MHAVSYVRISDNNQSNFSLASQQREIESYCQKNNITLVKSFTDNGQSAFTFDRKEWRELETYIKANKKIKYIVVFALDRFSRSNIAEALTKMDAIQKKLNVKLLTVTDPLNLDTDEMGVQLKRVIELLFSNFELQKIRKRTSDGMYQSQLEGRHVATAPYGYVNAKDANGKKVIAINEDKAYHVRTIFRLFLRGYSHADIRRHINKYGANLVGNSAIQKILNNPVYAGYVNARGKLINGIHSPIISRLDYWAAQNKMNSKKNTKQKSENVYLRGVLKCHCGKLLTSSRSKGKTKHYSYYLCECDRKHLSAIKLHKQFDAILKYLSLNDEHQKMLSEKMQTLQGEKNSTRVKDTMRAKLELQKVNDKIESVSEKYLLNPDMSEKAYKKVIAGLNETKERLQDDINGLSATKNIKPVPLTDISGIFHTLPIHRQHDFINMVFDNGLYYQDGIYRTPFLLSLFSHNQSIMHEKGLLILDSPDKVSLRGINTNFYNDVVELMDILKAG